MKATTPEREAIYSFFQEYLGMNAEDIAECFETTHSTLQRKKSGKLEACHRITLRLFGLENIEDEEDTKADSTAISSDVQHCSDSVKAN